MRLDLLVAYPQWESTPDVLTKSKVPPISPPTCRTPAWAWELRLRFPSLESTDLREKLRVTVGGPLRSLPPLMRGKRGGGEEVRNVTRNGGWKTPTGGRHRASPPTIQCAGR